MSTHAIVAVQVLPNKIKWSYVHYDGHPQYMRSVLPVEYNTLEDAKILIHHDTGIRVVTQDPSEIQTLDPVEGEAGVVTSLNELVKVIREQDDGGRLYAYLFTEAKGWTRTKADRGYVQMAAELSEKPLAIYVDVKKDTKMPTDESKKIKKLAESIKMIKEENEIVKDINVGDTITINVPANQNKTEQKYNGKSATVKEIFTFDDNLRYKVFIDGIGIRYFSRNDISKSDSDSYTLKESFRKLGTANMLGKIEEVQEELSHFLITEEVKAEHPEIYKLARSIVGDLMTAFVDLEKLEEQVVHAY